MIDSHCHLDHEPLFADLDNVINRAKDIGVKKFLTICTNKKSYENIITFIDKILFSMKEIKYFSF